MPLTLDRRAEGNGGRGAGQPAKGNGGRRGRWAMGSEASSSSLIPAERSSDPMGREWAGLPLDVVASIFAKLSADDVMSGAGLVCHPWLEAAKVPDLWRSIDMAHITVDHLFKFNTDYCTMAKVAVHRADGRLESFAGNFFVSDELLCYITERSPSLKILTVISSSDVTNDALGAIVDGCPRLELLHVSDCANISVNATLKAKCARIEILELVPWDEDDDPYYWYWRRQDSDYWGN
uniref:Uncharacterized protein n=1 Tax=Avena sativa TaxID=4498 RepID=A0ACD5YDH4_AVESA